MPKDKKEVRAGYRIHFDRLKNLKCDTKAIRTHKFKCAIPSQKVECELKEKLSQIAAVVDSSGRGSLLWFLIHLYGLGFLFVSKAGAKSSLLKKLDPSSYDKELLSIEGKYKDSVRDKEALYCFVTKTPRDVAKYMAEGKLPPSIIKSLGEIFGGAKVNASNLSEHSEVYSCYQDLWSYAEERKGLKAEDLQDFFKVTLLVSNDDPDNQDTTFVIQDLPLDQIKENIAYMNAVDSGEQWDIYKAYFRCLQSASLQTGVDLQSLAGLTDNQNALSNLWNVTLKRFQESEEKCRELLAYGNPKLFERQPERLDLLAREVYRISCEVAKASDVDFIAQNWSEYRALVGGRFQGWLSNFKNRLQDFEKELSEDQGHDKVFREIEAKCHWQKLFPEEQRMAFAQLKALRKELASLLGALFRGEGVQSDRSFDKVLEEYRHYLKPFREYLMKLNNEGVRQRDKDDEKLMLVSTKDPRSEFNIWIDKSLFKTDKKEVRDSDSALIDSSVLGFWSTMYVPKDLPLYPRFMGESKKNPFEEIDRAHKRIAPLIVSAHFWLICLLEVNPADTSKIKEEWLSLKGNQDNSSRFHRHLDSLRKLWMRGEKRAKTELFSFIDSWIDKKQNEDLYHKWSVDQKDLSNIRFFASGREPRKPELLPVKPVDFDEYVEQFRQNFRIDMIRDEVSLRLWLGLENGYAGEKTQEKGELLKIYWALLLRQLPDSLALPVVDDEKVALLRDMSLSGIMFDDQGKMKKDPVPLKQMQRMMAAGVGSLVRSYLSLLSRRDFVQRYVVQTTNGQQSSLRYVPLEWSDEEDLNGNKEQIQKYLEALQEKIKNKRGKDGMALKRLKGKRRRLKRALKNIKTLQEKGGKGFTDEQKSTLRAFDIDVDLSNLEIAQSIWKALSANKKTRLDQKKLSQILGAMPHRWEMLLTTKVPLASLEVLSLDKDVLLFQKDQGGTIDYECAHILLPRANSKKYYYSFPLQTSVYQKQFLERFLWGDRQGKLDFRAMGASLILEWTEFFVWKDGHLGQTQSKDFLMYYAIPFELTTQGEKVAQGKPRRETEQRLLGIDLGEYGFGWAVWDEKSEKIIDSGFQKIPLLKKMREDAAGWKDTQARGLFSRPTTHLADIREKAAGQTRNQIHRLAMKYSAKPVYEDSVDSFESGGQRISKLYKTLKTSDVMNRVSTDADKQVRSHIWGDAFTSVGAEIGASYTSQTCRCCGRSAVYDLRNKYREQKDSVLVSDKKAQGVKGEITCGLDDGTHALTAILNEVQRAQRKEKKGTEKERGYVARFICQYDDCAHKTDADEQAAKNIALKYYFRRNDRFKEERERADESEQKVYDNGKNQFATLKLFMNLSLKYKNR